MKKRVLVGNVSRRVSEEELEDFFSEVGEVVSVSIPADDAEVSGGFAVVEFSDGEEAEQAIETLDEATLDGKRLRVGWAGKGQTPGARRLRMDDGDEDYSRRDRGRSKKGKKHGSDRVRGKGRRRVVD